VFEARERLRGQPAEPGQVEVDVVTRQIELLEIRPDGLGGEALLAQICERGGAMPLRELPAVRPEQQSVGDELRRVPPAGSDESRLQLRVRTVIAAAEDVRYLEIEVVDGRRELVGRRPVDAEERGTTEAQGTLGVRLAYEMRRLTVAHVPLALA